jgi:5-bromo-4-chloroindolyl phosphate hydrolysis protein
MNKFNTTYIYDLHNIYKNWLNELALSKDEIAYFRKNLETVATANNKIEVTAFVESFQNKFITHLNELQLLTHDVKEAEKIIENNIKENPIAADHRKLALDDTLNDRMQQFNKLFRELKMEYNTFLARTL